jgi:hypothetical protein
MRQWRLVFLGAALLNAVTGGVLRILRTPVRLRHLAPRCLALGLTAGVLTWSYSLVGTKPLAADRARCFPGCGHRESSSLCPANLVLGR